MRHGKRKRRDEEGGGRSEIRERRAWSRYRGEGEVEVRGIWILTATGLLLRKLTSVMSPKSKYSGLPFSYFLCPNW